jgi:hypothetical protein
MPIKISNYKYTKKSYKNHIKNEENIIFYYFKFFIELFFKNNYLKNDSSIIL